MATSVILSTIAATDHSLNLSKTGSSVFPKKTSFLCGDTKKLFSAHLCSTSGRLITVRKFMSPSATNSFDNIPKQFREENLKDGLMENYKNTPEYLYGLSPSQMGIFTQGDSLRRQSEKVMEETISSASSYRDNSGMWSLSALKDAGRTMYSRGISMSSGRGGGRRSPPPDLPSILLDARIIYLGMPIVPAVAELIIAQFMWCDYDDITKPIYLYINSSGVQDNSNQVVGSDTDAYAIADIMALCKSKIYTVNLAKAYGQAAMLLSLGAKGFRALLPSSTTQLYLPDIYRSSGDVTDMWIKAKELEVNTDYYLELLVKGIGKPVEEIAKDIRLPKYFNAQATIDYGIADKILKTKEDGQGMMAQSKAKRSPGALPTPQLDFS